MQKKVIVVDDEPMVIESILAGIDWKKLDIDVCDCFTDSRQALDYIYNNDIDIVITDVTMPPFSGLILCSRILEIRPNVQFIIISGYADFSYAQKSMQFGAIGYCLKPIDYTELTGYLKKAVQIQPKISDEVQYEFIEYIYENNVEQMQKQLSELGISGSFYMAVSIGKICLAECLKSFCCTIGLGEYLYISNKKISHSLAPELIANKNLKGFSYTQDPIHCEQLRDTVFQLTYDAYQFFFQPEQMVFSTGACYQNHILKKVKQLVYNTCELEKFLLGDTVGINHIQLAADIHNLVYYMTGNESCIYSYRQLTYSYKDYKKMVHSLLELLNGGKSEEQEYESNNKNFLNLIKYINSNYTADISIRSIADTLYLNPSYISQLFKKETGTTFVKYLTNLRISRAEELLTSTDLSIKDISEACGFHDYFYFIKTFKKHTLKTPSSYNRD